MKELRRIMGLRRGRRIMYGTFVTACRHCGHSFAYSAKTLCGEIVTGRMHRAFRRQLELHFYDIKTTMRAAATRCLSPEMRIATSCGRWMMRLRALGRPAGKSKRRPFTKAEPPRAGHLMRMRQQTTRHTEVRDGARR